MRILWLLFITVLLVCGKSDSFEEINDSDIKRETSTNDEDQKAVENSLSSNPVYNFTRRKRSLIGEERMKKQQKFHSWGGKRNDDKDEEEKDEQVDETNSFEHNDAEREDINVINKTFPKGFLKEDNMISYVKGFKGFEDNIPQEDKRDPEITNDLRKRSHFYDSFLQQNGFYPELSEQNSKRYPAFNSWAGKRSTAFNSWGGKRAAPFNSWGGKRQAAFSSWGGKRDAAFNSWGGKRETSFNSWGGKRDTESNNWGRGGSASFNSWGGKRGASFNSWGGKRAAAFNSWGGKRSAAFNSWGGKRTAAFNSWAGKRDLDDLNKWEKVESLANHNTLEQANDSYKTLNNIDYLTKQQDYDIGTTKYSPENIKGKRVAGFNSFTGKRIGPFNSQQGGKKSAAFNSWGGKRSSSSFNSWGGKRGDLYNSLAGKSTFDVVESPTDVQDTSHREISYESRDIGRSDEEVSTRSDSNDLLQKKISHWIRNKPKTEVFESELNKDNELISPGNEHEWQNTEVGNKLSSGQRYFDPNKEEINKRSNRAFSSWAGKRAPLFTPWYSNKTPSLLISSGKRRPAFSSWGGKRSELHPLEGTSCYNSNSNECLDLTESNVIQPDKKKLNGESREKREVNCSSDEEISAHDAPGKSFINKKIDEDIKNNRVMTRMLFQGGLSRPMAIKSFTRGLDFYAWGGKRSL